MRRLGSKIAGGLILAVSLLSAESQQPDTQQGPPTESAEGSTHKSAPHGIPNFHQVTPSLYRGAQPSSTGLKNLANLGVNIVVDLRGDRESEREEVTKLGMQYVAIPWHCYNPHDDVFASFLTLLRENPNKKVFVHCRLGDDRTGMMIASYRMAEEGWSAERAMKEMQSDGFSYAHHWICPRLESYEQRFPQTFRSSPAFQSLRDKVATPHR